MKCNIRWMRKDDIAQIREIEALSFRFPWNDEDFKDYARAKSTMSLVAEVDSEVVGVVLCETFKTAIHILNLAVHPDWRRNGIASALVYQVLSKLRHGRRDRVFAALWERNTPAQKFFRKVGFTATAILHDVYEPGTPYAEDDAYLFEYYSAKYAPENRISQYYARHNSAY